MTVLLESSSQCNGSSIEATAKIETIEERRERIASVIRNAAAVGGICVGGELGYSDEAIDEALLAFDNRPLIPITF